MMSASCFLRISTSDRKDATTSVAAGVSAETDGDTTSTTLSASSAMSSRLFPAMEEASTIRTFGGSRWRKSSRRRGPLESVS